MRIDPKVVKGAMRFKRFEILKRSQVIKNVPDRYEALYGWIGRPEFRKRLKRLRTLEKTKKLTIKNVNKVIGDESMTRLLCDSCNRSSVRLVVIPCHDGPIGICGKCLSKSAEAMDGA